MDILSQSSHRRGAPSVEQPQENVMKAFKTVPIGAVRRRLSSPNGRQQKRSDGSHRRGAPSVEQPLPAATRARSTFPSARCAVG